MYCHHMFAIRGRMDLYLRQYAGLSSDFYRRIHIDLVRKILRFCDPLNCTGFLDINDTAREQSFWGMLSIMLCSRHSKSAAI